MWNDGPLTSRGSHERRRGPAAHRNQSRAADAERVTVDPHTSAESLSALSRVQQKQPEIASNVRQALASVRDYHDWLVANRSTLNHPSAIGLEQYNWFIKHVRLMPYTADDLRGIAEVESSRARAFLKIEQAVNRNLPELKLARSEQEYAARVQQAEELIRTFLTTNHLLTVPDYVGPQKTDAFWIERPSGKHHFWEEIQYRDPW